VSDEPVFHVAAESDSGPLLQFMREYYAFDGHHFDEIKTPLALSALLRDPALGRVWLISDGEAPAGYIVVAFGYSLEWLGRDAFVDEFYLRKEYRGRGWGRKTMAFVEDAARAMNIAVLHLEVVQRNRPALGIYQRLGFKAHASTFLSKALARR